MTAGKRPPEPPPDLPSGTRPEAHSPWARRLGGTARRLRGAARLAAPALLCYAGVRAVGVLLIVVWGHQRGTPGLETLATLWDAGWYTQIAALGYDHSLPVADIVNGHHEYTDLAFFPAYPALITAVHTVLPLPLEYVALLVAWVGALAAAWGIFAVTAARYGRRTGVIAAVLWGVLPHAVVEGMAYTEPVFTAFAAWALYAVVTRRWVWAGVLAVLAGLTRPSGVAVAAAVCAGAAAELVAQLRRRRTAAGGVPTAFAGPPGSGGTARRAAAGWRRPLLGAVLAPLGWLGFVGWVGLRLGRWNGYFQVQMLWRSRFDWGASTLHDLRLLFVHAQPVTLGRLVVACVLFGAVVLFALSLVHRQALPLLVFSAVILLIALGDAAYFPSRARFLLPAFPLLLPLATALARVRSRASTVILLSAATAFSTAYGGYLVFVCQTAP
ncbi:hypothetical protein [Streptacidiphilus griseoplanus]|uniref:hypothetical protein n=1 Tax=Peterkaempfera griseoplana TaxID=66896 RepID=UPI001FDEDC8B|nr:hypothetical protein [Peterkaempfera griseoplana]